MWSNWKSVELSVWPMHLPSPEHSSNLVAHWHEQKRRHTHEARENPLKIILNKNNHVNFTLNNCTFNRFDWRQRRMGSVGANFRPFNTAWSRFEASFIDVTCTSSTWSMRLHKSSSSNASSLSALWRALKNDYFLRVKRYILTIDSAHSGRDCPNSSNQRANGWPQKCWHGPFGVWTSQKQNVHHGCTRRSRTGECA